MQPTRETLVTSERSDEEADNMATIRRWLVRYCARFTRSRDDCEDIVQETLLRCLPVLTGETAHPNWRGYLCRTARHLWIDHVRHAAIADTYLAGERRIAEDADHSKTDWLQVEDALYDLLKHATTTGLTVWILRDGFGFRTDEVAQRMQRSEASVKSLLHRLRRHVYSAAEELNTSSQLEFDEGRRGLAAAYATAIRNADIDTILALAQRVDAGFLSVVGSVQVGIADRSQPNITETRLFGGSCICRAA